MGTVVIWWVNAVLTERRRENSEGLRVIFGEYSDIVKNDILTMQRFLEVSRFLYSGGWQVCSRQVDHYSLANFSGSLVIYKQKKTSKGNKAKVKIGRRAQHDGCHRRVVAMLHMGQVVLQVMVSSTSYRSRALL